MIPNQRQRILTPQERQAHIDYCRASDFLSQWGMVGNPQHYEDLGDIATVESNRAHDLRTGFSEFLPNTLEWIIALAVSRKWASMTILHG